MRATLRAPSDHRGTAKAGDLVRAITVLGEHRIGVRAELGRRPLDARSAMGEFERGERHPERTVDAGSRVEFMEYAALGEMRVGKGFGHRPHAGGRHVARLEI